MKTRAIDDYGFDAEEPRKSNGLRRFLSALNKHKWAILFGLLLAAGIVAASIVFWSVIVGFAPVAAAAVAISAVTLKIGFAVSATAFAATSISIVGSAFVAAASFIFDEVFSRIKNRISSGKSPKKPGLLDDPLIEDDLLVEDDDVLKGMSTADISQAIDLDPSAPIVPEKSNQDKGGAKKASDEEIINAKPMTRRFPGEGAPATPDNNNKFQF